VKTVIACGRARVDPKIARDGAAAVEIVVRRSLPPVLRRYQEDGYQLVALEQTTGSQSLPEYRFRRRTVLIVGHERLGVDDETLALVDAAVEIPVYGLPYSHNVATAAAIALYEYCRQFPRG
jgi:tRNA G18 (ribose-2'-O)-methylase SpoU